MGEMKDGRKSKSVVLLALGLAIAYLRPTIEFLSAICGIVVDGPQVLQIDAEGESILTPDRVYGIIKWGVFLLLAIVIWKLPPLSDCEARINKWLRERIGEPHEHNKRYYSWALFGGLVMASTGVAAAKNAGTGAITFSIVAGLAAFVATYMVSLAARSDTAPLEHELAESIKWRKDYKSQLSGQVGLVATVHEKLASTFSDYIASGENVLRKLRENVIEWKKGQESYDSWRMKVMTTLKSQPFWSVSHFTQSPPAVDIPLDLKEKHNESQLYKRWKADILRLEESRDREKELASKSKRFQSDLQKDDN